MVPFPQEKQVLDFEPDEQKDRGRDQEPDEHGSRECNVSSGMFCDDLDKLMICDKVQGQNPSVSAIRQQTAYSTCIYSTCTAYNFYSLYTDYIISFTYLLAGLIDGNCRA